MTDQPSQSDGDYTVWNACHKHRSLTGGRCLICEPPTAEEREAWNAEIRALSDPMAQTRADSRALLRIARELREAYAAADDLDPSFWRDVEAMERVGHSLGTAIPARGFGS